MKFLTTAALILAASTIAVAQQGNLMQIKTDASNRTIAVNADATITVDPDLAILHIGFITQPKDAKNCYAEGAQTSNNIITALKGAGIAETEIHSEGQSISSYDAKQHKFQLSEGWTVRVPPARVSEILDLAVNAGATDSGEIEWTVKDKMALEEKVLKAATLRARTRAQSIADGLEVKLGKVIYATNQVSNAGGGFRTTALMMDRSAGAAPQSAPTLAIEPHQVQRDATVYVVFAIE